MRNVIDQERLEPLFTLANKLLRAANQSQPVELTHYGYFEFVGDILGNIPTPQCSQYRLTHAGCHSLFVNLAG